MATLIGGEALIGNGRSGNVTTEFLELVALARLTNCRGMEGEAGLLGKQARSESFGRRRDGAQCQCFLARIGADGYAVMDGCTDELVEHLSGLEVEEIVVRITDQQALPLQETPARPTGFDFTRRDSLGVSLRDIPTILKLSIESMRSPAKFT